MTSCRDVDRLATAYIDGELDDRRSSAVRGHLRVCARCAELVEDEARVRELAAGLDPIDPSPSMWQAIDRQLADAEIGDSHRSATWLLVQRGLDAVRRNALLVGLPVAGAAILLLLWLPRPDDADESGRSPQRVAATADGVTRVATAAESGAGSSPAEAGCAGAATHQDLIACQAHRSDGRYLDAIADLTRAVAEERASWSAADASRFDAALAELERAAQDERLQLAGQPAAAAPANRDSLHSIYRAQLELLSGAVVAGDFSEAAPWRGAP